MAILFFSTFQTGRQCSERDDKCHSINRHLGLQSVFFFQDPQVLSNGLGRLRIKDFIGKGQIHIRGPKRQKQKRLSIAAHNTHSAIRHLNLNFDTFLLNV